ncbi:MAG: efflux RND transporter periplasmic adaptor subunit [bacterium]|jgi:RND family efflux transporter MFP subunit
MADKEHYDIFEEEPLPEGEETAPPYTHTMAIVRWGILGALSVFAVVMLLGFLGLSPWAGSEAKAAQYHCPMHPTYISNQPGDCPICGMSLVPINAEGKEIAEEHKGHSPAAVGDSAAVFKAKPGQYYCWMDPEVVSDTPGKCPVCGMNLEIMPDTPPQFTCPMHPEVISNAPGDCPKCGMYMEKIDAGAGHEGHQMSGDEGNVPGLVPVTIEPKRLQLIGIKTAKVERTSLGGGLKLVGYLAPDETRLARINVRAGGWVQQLYVNQEGQLVKEGEILLTIYSQDLFSAGQDYITSREMVNKAGNDTSLARIRRQVMNAARDRLRLLGLSDDEIGQIEKSSSPLSEIALRSPFSGYVMEKNVIQGAYVSPEQTLLTIADLSRIWVIADVFESDFSRIRVGQKGRLQLAAYPDKEFAGRISFIYPSVSSTTRTLKVRMEFDNMDGALKPGMYGDIQLSDGESSALTIPADALIDAGEMRYAFVVHKQTHFEPRMLKVGRRSDDRVEILEGLHEGEEVVTSANFLIDSESRLQAAISGMGATQAGGHEGHGK